MFAKLAAGKNREKPTKKISSNWYDLPEYDYDDVWQGSPTGPLPTNLRISCPTATLTLYDWAIEPDVHLPKKY